MPSAESASAAAVATCTVADQETMVTSLPWRAVRATPNGMAPSPSGTSPSSPHMFLCSQYTTGSSERIAVFSRPKLSAGVPGPATSRPGMLAYKASRECEYWAAEDRHMPTGPKREDRRIGPEEVRKLRN